MSAQKIQQHLPIRGMSLDTEPMKQPDGFASFAYNAVHDSFQGSKGSLVNEPGTERTFLLPNFYRPVGRIMLQNAAIIFSTDETTSEIGLVDYDSHNYTTLISSECLGFRFDKPVTGVHRVVRGCERVIYFCDGLNADKAINIDRLSDYQTNGQWDCSLMGIDASFNTPLITARLWDHGNLEEGSYEFSICYMDDVNNIVGYTLPMARTHIFKPIDGQSRAVKIDISNLDQRYERYSIVVFQNNTVFRLPPRRIIGPTAEYYLSDLPSGTVEITQDEALVPNIRYESSEAMEQVEGRLLRAGLKEKSRDFLSYGEAVKNITINYQINEVDPEEYAPSLMRDEVYALGIMYQYTDGSFSNVFHIPNNGPYCDAGQEFEFCLAEGFRSDMVATRISATRIQADFTGLIDGDYTITYEIDANGGTVSGTTSAITAVGGAASFEINLTSGIPTDAQCHIFTLSVTTPLCEYREGNYGRFSLGAATGSIWEANRGHDVLTFNLEGNSSINGNLACYACRNSTYENPECGDYWGDLAGKPVRHFRMPDTVAEPLVNYDTGKIRQLGLRVSNVTYPESDITGHFIMIARRDDQDKTVISKGITGHLHFHNGTGPELDFEGFTYSRSSQRNPNGWSYFFSNEIAYQDQPIQGSYLKKEGEYLLQRVNPSPSCSPISSNEDEGYRQCYQYDGQGNILFGTNVKTYIMTAQLEGYQYNGVSQVEAINRSIFAPPYYYDDTIDLNRRIINASQLNAVQMIKLNRPLDNLNTSKVAYASIKSDRDVYCDIGSIVYLKGHDVLGRENVTQDIYPGDIFITDINWSNGLIGEEVRSNVDNIVKIAALTTLIGGIIAVGALTPLGPQLLNTLGGSAAQLVISAFTALGGAVTSEVVKAYYEMRSESGLDSLALIDSNTFGIRCCIPNNEDGIAFSNEHLSKVYIESAYRSEFRKSVATDSTCPEHFRGGDIRQYFGSKQTLINDDGERTIITKREPNFVPCPELYNYNPDFLIDRRGQYPAFEYIVCDKCPNTFPHMIINSELSFSEDRQDRYKVFLANNVLDIPSHTGDIVSLKYYNNVLYIHTEDSTYFIRPNHRELQLDGETINLGTGGFLNLVPQELSQGDLRVGGSQYKYGNFACEYGYVWVDAKNGDVYMRTSEGLNRISDQYVSHFMRRNLPSFIEANYREQVQGEYPALESMDPYAGNFLNIAYDPKFKRIIICKRDFIPDFDYTIRDVNNPVATPVYDTELKRFRQSTNGTVMSLIDGNQNGQYEFIPKNFSISYSFENKTWTSFHRWLSLCSYYTNKEMVTSNIIVDNDWRPAFHKHIDTKFGEFHDYGPEEFIVEYIDKEYAGARHYALSTVTKVYDYQPDNDSWIQIEQPMWSAMWAYNDTESTGKVSFINTNVLSNYYDAINYYNPALINFKYENEEFRISQMRNRLLSPSSVFYSNGDANAGFGEVGMRDKIVDPSAHNYISLSYYDEPTIKGKWVKVRMFFVYTSPSYKIVTDLILNKRGSYVR
jgi:hypothetical protein